MLPLLVLVLDLDLEALPSLLFLGGFGVALRERIFSEILLLTSSSALVVFATTSGELERLGLGEVELLLGEAELLLGEAELLLGDDDAFLFGAFESAGFADWPLFYFFFFSPV